MSKKKTLADIFNDDEFGILDSKAKNSTIKTEDERLIESFQDINAFFVKNNREPEATNVTEFKLLSRLKALRKDANKVEILKPYDSHNLLNTKAAIKSVEDILNDDDLGILDTDETASIFKLQHVKSASERAETDFTAQRKAMNNKDFLPYESLFKKVQIALKDGKRSLSSYAKAGSNLEAGSYYILNGMLLFLEEASIETENVTLPSGNRLRKDGRTRIIFENGTISNMKYRSLDKALLHKENDGRIVSHTATEIENELFNKINSVVEEDVQTGWVYVLRSKSTNPEIATINDLYKIGFSSIDVNERIKNASKESTYLYADVHLLDKYACYNMDAQKFEHLIHRFFAEVCLNVDVFDEKRKRITPREWFVAPRPIIDKVVTLILSGEIVNFKYNSNEKLIKLK
jgi:hypothetical protein